MLGHLLGRNWALIYLSSEFYGTETEEKRKNLDKFLEKDNSNPSFDLSSPDNII